MDLPASRGYLAAAALIEINHQFCRHGVFVDGVVAAGGIRFGVKPMSRSGVSSDLGDIMMKRWIPIAILLAFNVMHAAPKKRKTREWPAQAGS